MNTEKKLGNLMINGFGSSNGGEFDSAIINGVGTINGSIQSESFVCNGSGTVNGDIKSDRVKISGNCKIGGKVYSNTCTVEGRASIGGEMFFHKLTISGTSSIGGSVKGEEMKVQGKVKIGENCEVESFKSDGQFTIGGLLSAETIDIYTHGECKALEIGGQTISVKQKNNFFLDIIKTVKSVKLHVDLIEGDNINLENTKAKIVRGNHIIIGENSEIDRVEYKDSFELVGNAQVSETVKL